MSAIEEIQAAIEKLTAHVEKSVAGPWSAWHPQSGLGNSSVDAPSGDPDNPKMPVEGQRDDVDLIVILHATIGAQIKLLTGCILLHAAFVKAGCESDWLAAVERAGDLDLARAINGTEPDHEVPC